jgi:predicted TIM-barrel fold metal-dependent hydrolase
VDRAGLDELWRVFGADRLIYGSNWPVSDRVAPYGRVIAAVREYFGGKGEAAARKYFWDNAVAAYRFHVSSG